jgi:uroporphyrinogen-III decarboxylase
MASSRDRFIAAINHKQPDKVPADMGSTPVSGIAASTLNKLRKALGLEEKLVKVHEPFQILGEVEEDVMDALKLDIIGLWGRNNFFGFQNKDWKPWKLQDGTDVLIGGGFTAIKGNDGGIYYYPKGDLTAKPSAKLPKGGYYFDNIVRQEPIEKNKLNGKKDFSEQFTLFNEEDLKFLEKTADDLYRNTEYGITGNFFGVALGDLGIWTAPGLKKTPGIRKPDDWYMAHILYPDYVKEVYEYITEIALANLKLYKQAVADKIQVITVCGTDFGTQRGEFISHDMFREFYKPYFKKVNDWIHKNTSWKTFYHSCGSILNIIDDLIESGMDILNPVQCSAKGMDPVMLKEKYGNRITFWGGAIDTQKTLPFGTAWEVKKETMERLEIFSKNGGFIFNATHNIQQNTPVENILAYFSALHEFNSKHI